MIKSPQEYLFVDGDNATVANPQGDLSRIMMNGKILPTLAQDEKPWKVRGEDVAFLLEAACERLAVANNEYPPVRGDHATFSRYRSAAQMRGIVSLVKSGLTLTDDGRWIKPGESWPSDPLHSGTSNPLDPSSFEQTDPFTVLSETFLQESDMTADTKAFYRHALIDVKEIMKLYDDVKAMETVCLPFKFEDLNQDFYNEDKISQNFDIQGNFDDGLNYSVSHNIYFRLLSGSWTGLSRDPHWELDHDVESKIKVPNISWTDDRLRYLTGPVDLWLRCAANDDDFLRPSYYEDKPRNYAGYALIKVGTLNANAIQNGTLTFPSNLLTETVSKSLNLAIGDNPYSGRFPPFVYRNASAYHPDITKQMGWVSHHIAVYPHRFYLIARLRDRTRWQTPDENQ